MLKLQVLKNMTFVNDIFIGLAFSVTIRYYYIDASKCRKQGQPLAAPHTSFWDGLAATLPLTMTDPLSG